MGHRFSEVAVISVEPQSSLASPSLSDHRGSAQAVNNSTAWKIVAIVGLGVGIVLIATGVGSPAGAVLTTASSSTALRFSGAALSTAGAIILVGTDSPSGEVL